MGCGASYHPSTPRFRSCDLRGQGSDLLELAIGLGLTRTDLDKLWAAFQRFDMDQGGTISIDEFIVVGRLEQAETYGRLVFRLYVIGTTRRFHPTHCHSPFSLRFYRI